MSHRSLRRTLDFVEAALIYLMRKMEKLAMAQETLAEAEAVLATAVSGLADNFGVLDAAVTDGLVAIKNAATAGDVAAVHAQADRLAALSAKMASDATDIRSALTPAQTAAAASAASPAPEPAPGPA